MKAWLNTLPTWLLSRDCVLVTVARVEGSTPREAGASMLFGVDEKGQTLQVDTIGGGHLEWQATDIAQRMLAGSESTHSIHFERFNLSARLGQCCGGVVWLIFEKIPSDYSQRWQASIKALEQGACLLRTLRHDQRHSTWTTQATGKNRVQLDHSTAKNQRREKVRRPKPYGNLNKKFWVAHLQFTCLVQDMLAVPWSKRYVRLMRKFAGSTPAIMVFLSIKKHILIMSVAISPKMKLHELQPIATS